MKALVLLPLLLSVLCMGQVSTRQNQLAGMKPPCLNAEIVETEYKAHYTEVEYRCNDKVIEVAYDEHNNIIYTESETEIPQETRHKIIQKLDKSFENWEIDETLLVETTDTAFYKVELMKGGIEENVYFSLNGKYFKPNKLPVSEPWTIASLSGSGNMHDIPFDFLKPDKVYELPEILREISGLVWLAENEVYLVQDEIGAVFRYKLEQEKIGKLLRFGSDGDYEDLAIAGDHLYVLRSDGTIFSFNHRSFNGKVEQTVAPTKCTNIEGLCFDAESNLLLLACKSAPVSGSTDTRLLYSMPREKIHHTTINTVISREEINKMLFKKYRGLLSGNSDLQINPSAIAVHPKTGQRYILSASNRLLAIYDNNKLLDVFPLPSELYYKPEGLAFSDNGDLYISSEGMKNGAMSGRIFFFRKR